MDFTAASLTANAIALISIGVAVWTRLGVRRDAARAAAASERSAAAAERADGRAAEQMAAGAVTWGLVQIESERVQVVNEGPETAYRVSVVASPRTPGGPPVGYGEWPVLLKGDRVPEPIHLDGRLCDGWVEVTWQLEDSEDGQRRLSRLRLPTASANCTAPGA